MAPKTNDKQRQSNQADYFPSRELDKYVLRMPDGLRDRIKRVAEENGRSMNAEMIARLEGSLEQDEVSKITKEDVEHALAIARGAEANERLLASLTAASERLEAATRRHLSLQSRSVASIGTTIEAFISAVKQEAGELSPEVTAMGRVLVANTLKVAHDLESMANK
ncbi:Arc family DNA-binding protein [Martelella lutilitoris]|uniref:Arc family DNA-binding protein n=2 Tax=Martelella lutilitoris TaxID=2583532 RepID=A0A5C4JMH1_9HYPH|nr:Arc family DNA-binding protein [Martelella lutilitoris]